MSNAFNLYDLKNFKAVGSDIVSPWIDGLLDGKNIRENDGRSAQIFSYPVERILTPESSPEPVLVSDKVFDIHIVQTEGNTKITGSGGAVSDTVAVLAKPAVDLEQEVSYFTFIAGNSLYALPALNISEIIRYKNPVNIFSKKSGHLGIILYRNRMVPIYDFLTIANGIMDIKNGFKYIVVCIYDNKFFGLAVTEIKNITAVKNKNLVPSASFKFKNSNNITSDVFEDGEGKFYSAVDLKSVFGYLTS
jgi:chemotaxis signal transduction protein